MKDRLEEYATNKQTRARVLDEETHRAFEKAAKIAHENANIAYRILSSRKEDERNGDNHRRLELNNQPRHYEKDPVYKKLEKIAEEVYQSTQHSDQTSQALNSCLWTLWGWRDLIKVRKLDKKIYYSVLWAQKRQVIDLALVQSNELVKNWAKEKYKKTKSSSASSSPNN